MTLINFRLFSQVNNSSISGRVFIQKLSEELTGLAEQRPIPTPLAPIQEKVRY